MNIWIPTWPADIRRQRHIGDFTGWDTSDAIYTQALIRLLRDLQAD